MSAQPKLDLVGGGGLIPEAPLHASIANGDPMPHGPFSVGLSSWEGGDGLLHEGYPYIVTCGDGREVAGHVPSRPIAEAIADALNRAAE